PILDVHRAQRRAACSINLSVERFRRSLPPAIGGTIAFYIEPVGDGPLFQPGHFTAKVDITVRASPMLISPAYECDTVRFARSRHLGLIEPGAELRRMSRHAPDQFGACDAVGKAGPIVTPENSERPAPAVM